MTLEEMRFKYITDNHNPMERDGRSVHYDELVDVIDKLLVVAESAESFQNSWKGDILNCEYCDASFEHIRKLVRSLEEIV